MRSGPELPSSSSTEGAPVGPGLDAPTARLRGDPPVSRLAKRLWALAFLLGPLATIAFFAVFDDPPQPPSDWRLQGLEAVASTSEIPPPDAADWRAAGPGALAVGSEERIVSVWFRAPVVDRAGPSVPQSLYFPDPHGNFAVYLDSDLVWGPKAFEEPLAHFHRPLLVALPDLSSPAADHPAPRWLHFRLADRWAITLDPEVYAGPSEPLRSAHASRTFRVQAIPRITAAAGIALAVLMSIFSLLRPEETYYRWFAISSGLHGVRILLYLSEDLPISSELHNVLVALCLIFSLTGLIFVHRFYEIHRPRFERVLWWTAGVLGAVLVLSMGMPGPFNGLWAVHVWTPALGLLGFYTIAQYLIAAIRTPRTETLTLGLVYVVGSFLIVHDLLWTVAPDWVPTQGPIYEGYYGIVITLAFGFVIMARFVATARERDALTADLQQRVDEKTRELEASHERLRSVERDRVLASERSRLMRDMHDGLGGQLVHAIALSEGGGAPTALGNVLHSAVDDLRLIIDSLSPEAEDLAASLASIRHRIATFAEQAGIRLTWHTEALGSLRLSPVRSLAFTRLLQEALTNAIRHSGASNIDVRFDVGGDIVELSVSDDGGGIPEQTQGRGLGNMRSRATELEGMLEIETSPAGTTIRCRAPVSVQSEGSTIPS